MSEIGNKIHRRVATLAFIIARTRLWSRLGMICYMILLHQLVFWVFGLPDITTAQTVIISVVTGLSTPLTVFYLKSGKYLYRTYTSLSYSNKWIAAIDHVGYVIDKFRLFPLLMLVYYGTLLYLSLLWGMDLGDALSAQQAAFISTFGGATSLVFGFFITSGEVNMKLEEEYEKRHDVETNDPSDTGELDAIVSEYTKNHR